MASDSFWLSHVVIKLPFAYVSKLTWEISSLYADVSEALALLNNRLSDEDVETSLTVLDCFTVLLYHRTIVL